MNFKKITKIKLMHLLKQGLLNTTLVSALVLTSCGKKKEATQQIPPSTPAPAPSNPPPANAPSTSTSPSPNQVGSPNGSETPIAPGSGPGKSATNNSNSNDFDNARKSEGRANIKKNRIPKEKLNKSSKSNSNSSSAGSKKFSFKPLTDHNKNGKSYRGSSSTGNSLKDHTSIGHEPHEEEKQFSKNYSTSLHLQGSGSVENLTGEENKFGLLFTGANNDYSLQQLVRDEHSKSFFNQSQDSSLAKSLWDLKYRISDKGILSIFVTTKTDDQVKNYQVTSYFDSNKTMGFYSAGLEREGLTLTAVCIDASKSYSDCSNILLDIKKGTANVKAILRHAYADLNLEYNSTVNSKEYREYVSFFLNSFEPNQSLNKIKTIQFNSFEVVNGKSGYEIIIVGEDTHVIGFKSDLLIRNDYTAPMNEVEKILKYNRSELDMIPVSINYQYLDAIQSASLIKNDGQGNLRFKVKIYSDSTKQTNDSYINIYRKSTSTSL